MDEVVTRNQQWIVKDLETISRRLAMPPPVTGKRPSDDQEDGPVSGVRHFVSIPSSQNDLINYLSLIIIIVLLIPHSVH